MAAARVAELAKDLEELRELASEARHARVKALLAASLADLEEEKAAAEKEAAAEAEAEEGKKEEEEEEEAAAKKAKEEEEEEKKKKKEEGEEEAKKEEAKKKAKEEEEKKAKEEAKKEKAEEKEEAHADPEAEEGDLVLPSGLIVTADAQKAMRKLKKVSRKSKNTAAVLAISGKTLDLEDWLKDAEVEDITDVLEDTEPRFIFYSYNKTMPDGRLKTPLVLIVFTPEKAPPRKLMEATRWANEVSNWSEVVKTLEVRSLDDFDQDWFDSVS